MNKDLIIEVLKTAGFEEDETKLEDIAIKLENLHGEEVQGLVDNKNEIIAEKKTLQNQFKSISEENSEIKEKLNKFKDIPDPLAALNALDAVKNANLERDVDAEVQKAVQERTRTLVEENTHLRSENDNLKILGEQKEEEFIKQTRKRDFENQITISAQKNNINPDLFDEYRFNIGKVFNEFDEDVNRFVAKHEDGRPMFGKKQTTKPVDIDLYTTDYLLPSKPFFAKDNVNPSIGGNTGDISEYSEMFYMRGNFAKPTEKGYEFFNKEGPEKFEIAKQKFEKSQQRQNDGS